MILRIIDQEQSIQICPFKDNWKRSVSIIATFANLMTFITHFIFIEYCSFSDDILTRTKWSLRPVLSCDNHRIIIRWVFSTERWYLSRLAQAAVVKIFATIVNFSRKRHDRSHNWHKNLNSLREKVVEPAWLWYFLRYEIEKAVLFYLNICCVSKWIINYK